MKSLQDYLDEDPSLKDKYTYEEFQQKKHVPKFEDISIEEAYSSYCKSIDRINR